MFSFLGNPPFVTFAVFAVCCFNLLFHPSLSSVCLWPSQTFPRFQLYRIFTYPFYHAGIFHLLFNMLAWMTMAKDLENTIGSLALLYTVFVLFIPFAAIIEGLAAVVADAILPVHYWNECSVGISGVLFAILVVQLQLSGDETASFFGFFDMPIHLFPWILAALLQLLSPNLSLLGHLSGIVVGYALAYGYFARLTPSDQKFEEWEHWLRLTRLPAWQPVPSMFAGILNYLLPLPSNSNTPTITDRVRSFWNRITSAFSPSSESAEYSGYTPAQSTRPAQWTGVGRALGTAADPPPTPSPTAPSPVAQLSTPGRIPETSRLLRENPPQRSPPDAAPVTTSVTTQMDNPPPQ